jgi:hypothetical protein
MPERHRTEHDLLGQLLGFRFDHQHASPVPATIKSSCDAGNWSIVGFST